MFTLHEFIDFLDNALGQRASSGLANEHEGRKFRRGGEIKSPSAKCW